MTAPAPGEQREDHPIGLSIRNAVKVYPGTRALTGVDFDIRMGAVNAEERLALAVKRPEAFVYGSFSTGAGS